MKKAFSLLLSVVMLCSVLFMNVYASDFSNTYKNTGNYIADIIGVASTQIGYSASGSLNKYNKRFDNETSSASAAFIAWCAEQSGVPSSTVSYDGTIQGLLSRFEDSGKIMYSSVLGGQYAPEKGDIVFLTTQTGDFSKCSNVGLISYAGISEIKVIFGDINSTVTQLTIKKDDNLLLGYASPEYNKITPFSKGRYKTTANLNFRIGPSVESGSVKDANGKNIVIPNGTSVSVTDISGGWGYTTYAGKSGWISLEYASYYTSLPDTENTNPGSTELKVKWNVMDVSGWQGDIDWSKVKSENLQGVILRLGVRYSKARNIHLDSKFDRNYKNASQYSIPVGCYFYSVAYSVADAKEEAEFVVKTLQDGGYIMDFPIYFDIEDESMRYLGRTALSEITDAFCTVIEDAGYLAGIYCSKSWADSYLNSTAIKSRPMWIAQWASSCTYSGDYGMWQYTDKGSIAGIPYNGAVDLNICYINYPYYIQSNGYNGYTKPITPDPDPEPDPEPDPTPNPDNPDTTLDVKITPATCTTPGSIKKYDPSTGKLVSSKLIEPTGHKFADSVPSDGKLKCSDCGEILIDIMPEHISHKYTLKQTISATCKNEGLCEVYCETCDNMLIGHSIINLTSHSTGEHIITEAKCTQDGTDEVKCSECGTQLSYELIPSSGHQCDSWSVISKPDSTGKVGVKRGTCKVCGEFVYVYTEYDPNEETELTLGDIDGNGKITVNDARLLLRYAAKLISLTPAQQKVCDVNKDGKITLSDARLLLRVAARLETLS